MQYAVIVECVELDEGDYIDELFTNQQKWEEIVKREGLVWQR